MSRIYDLSPVLHPGIAVWPGDVPFERRVSLSLDAGHNLELSSVVTTVHLGAHADAPNHYQRGGAGIGQRPLERYFGPAEVVTARVGRGQRVQPEDLARWPSAPRVLIRTDTFPDPDQWNSDFAALDPRLVMTLADSGVVLIGLDTPSVDLQDDRELRSHQALAARDLAVLEGLILQGVPDGHYQLIALPLRLRDADASPVRAILLAEDG
jgi:arylformamidase